MHIMITDVVGKKRINLAYPIHGKVVAVVNTFSNNIQSEFTEPWMTELESGNKWIIVGTYTRRELTDLIEGRIELTKFDKHP